MNGRCMTLVQVDIHDVEQKGTVVGGHGTRSLAQTEGMILNSRWNQQC